LRFLPELVEFHTGMSARVGLPTEHLANGYEKELASPVYATAIGLLLKGMEDIEEQRNRAQFDVKDTKEEEQIIEEKVKSKGFLTGFIEKAREWFEAEPDADLK